MGAGVAITRLDLNASDLRCRAQRAGSIEAARRMLALALVLEGRPRMEAARNCGMDRRCATGFTATTPKGCGDCPIGIVKLAAGRVA